jgi:hypothetical protein
MTDRRGSRFVLEVLFLLALTVALTLANLRPLEIAGIMLIGWVIVAVLEWVAWREEPHYGSGLPPRYYVPQVNLPPAQPLEPVATGYPDARDEAPTWIASPALRAEMLGTEPVGEWPVAAPPVPAQPDAQEPEVDTDPWTRAEELPLAPLGELAPPEPEPEPVAAAEPVPAVSLPPVSAPQTRAPETSAPPTSAPPTSAPPTSAPPTSAPQTSAPPVSVAVEPTPEPEPEREPEPSLDVELARSAQGVARYSLDPLGDPAPRRRFGRGSAPEPDGVEVPARPEGVRALPGRTNRQD